MNNADPIMCCARCNQPLKIVCDEHGTEFVPDARMGEPIKQPSSKPLRGETAQNARDPQLPIKQKRGTVRLKERIIKAMQAGDPNVTWSTADVARALDAPAPSTSAEMCVLLKEGRVLRIALGQYRVVR